MDKKKLGIILLIILAIIAVAFVAFSVSNMKEDSKIAITSNKTLYNGSSLNVKLTDLNKTPISNESINITIKDKNGKKIIEKTIKSNSKGVAKLKLKLKKGKYTVNASFEGNDKYNGNSSTQKLTIKEKVKKTTVSQSKPTYQKYSPQFGTYVNEYTDSNGVQHIDGANGVRVSYDPSTGVETYDDGQGHVDSVYMG